MGKIFGSVVFIGVVGAVVITSSTAFFSDKETSSGNVFQSGSLDLKVNDLDNPPQLVSVDDLKPGDDYYFQKRLRVIDNPAYVWMKLNEFVNSQGNQTEPETEYENQFGEKSDLQSVLEYDLKKGDETLIDATESAVLENLQGCWIPLGEFPGSQELVVEQSFHMGSSVGNWAQGDTLSFSEEFYAEQVRNNPNPSPPEADKVWDSGLKRCVLPPLELVFVEDEPTGFDFSDPIAIPEGYNVMTWEVSSTDFIINWAPAVTFDSGNTYRNQHRFECGGGICSVVTVPIISESYLFSHGTSGGNLTAKATLSVVEGAHIEVLGEGVSLPFESSTFSTDGFSIILVTVEQGNPQNLTGISAQRFEGGSFVEKEHLACGGAVCPLQELPVLGGDYRVVMEGSGLDALVAMMLRP